MSKNNIQTIVGGKNVDISNIVDSKKKDSFFFGVVLLIYISIMAFHIIVRLYTVISVQGKGLIAFSDIFTIVGLIIPSVLLILLIDKNFKKIETVTTTKCIGVPVPPEDFEEIKVETGVITNFNPFNSYVLYKTFITILFKFGELSLSRVFNYRESEEKFVKQLKEENNNKYTLICEPKEECLKVIGVNIGGIDNLEAFRVKQTGKILFFSSISLLVCSLMVLLTYLYAKFHNLTNDNFIDFSFIGVIIVTSIYSIYKSNDLKEKESDEFNELRRKVLRFEKINKDIIFNHQKQNREISKVKNEIQKNTSINNAQDKTKVRFKVNDKIVDVDPSEYESRIEIHYKNKKSLVVKLISIVTLVGLTVFLANYFLNTAEKNLALMLVFIAICVVSCKNIILYMIKTRREIEEQWSPINIPLEESSFVGLETIESLYDVESYRGGSYVVTYIMRFKDFVIKEIKNYKQDSNLANSDIESFRSLKVNKITFLCSRNNDNTFNAQVVVINKDKIIDIKNRTNNISILLYTLFPLSILVYNFLRLFHLKGQMSGVYLVVGIGILILFLILFIASLFYRTAMKKELIRKTFRYLE